MLFTNGAEDKVGILLGHIFQFGLCTIEKTFSSKPSRSDGNLRLSHVIPCPTQILFHAQSHLDAHLLMRLQDIVKDILHRFNKNKGAHHEKENKQIAFFTVPEKEYKQVESHQ